MQLSDPRKNIGVLGVNFYCGRGDSPMLFPSSWRSGLPSARRSAGRWLRRRAHCGRLPLPLRRRHAHRLAGWRVAAALHSTWARAVGHCPAHPGKVRKAAPSPIGVLCGADLRDQRGGAFAVGHGTTAGVLEHLAELRVAVLYGRERCCGPRHQLAPVSGPCTQCVSFRAPERSGSRHSIIKRTLLAGFPSPRR